MDITNDELSFLKEHSLSVSDVFDASGMTGRYWKMEIRNQGKTVALGSPCKKASHRLKTRSGHCVQCDPRTLAFQSRYNSEGYVYIAGSLSAKLVKIGTAVDIEQRESNLRSQRYGYLGDWKIIFYIKCQNAGKVEQTALKQLILFQELRTYDKDGEKQKAQEILKCSFTKALNSIGKAVGKNTVAEKWMHPSWKYYDF